MRHFTALFPEFAMLSTTLRPVCTWTPSVSSLESHCWSLELWVPRVTHKSLFLTSLNRINATFNWFIVIVFEQTPDMLLPATPPRRASLFALSTTSPTKSNTLCSGPEICLRDFSRRVPTMSTLTCPTPLSLR